MPSKTVPMALLICAALLGRASAADDAAVDVAARAKELGQPKFSPLREIAHLGLRIGGRIAPQAALRRYDWIYGLDVTAA